MPTNWQDELLNRLDQNSVAEVYGKLSKDFLGGGRATVLLPSVSRTKAVSHIKLAHSRGFKFNYLLNASCFDNAEFTRSGQKKIRGNLDWLVSIGVDSVTVAVPYLLELIKRNYKGLEVSVSTQSGPDSPERVKFWEDLGADQVTLSCVDVNRDFAMLRSIRKRVKCRLQLIANLTCLYRCPFYHYHANINAHASQKNHASNFFFIDYCTIRCKQMKLLQPSQFIRSGWIRPEDLIFYEQIGIDKIKLVDRAMSTEDLLRIARAYTERRYQGNLFDLFSSPPKNISFKSLGHKLKYYLKPNKVNVFKMYKWKAIMEEHQIFLDNAKLEGFIQYFVDGKCTGQCGDCDYCEEWTRKVLEIPDEYRTRMLENYEKIFKDLIDGEVFSY